MKLEIAEKLIRKAVIKTDIPQHWADLGAGNGLFTQALSNLLPAKSSVLAIDKEESGLRGIKSFKEEVTIQKQVADFTALDLTTKFDGILLANALHYVQDQLPFLLKIKSYLLSNRLVIIEYDRRDSNPWVPYPLPFKELKIIGKNAGFASTEKLEQAPSVYGGGVIYSALLS